MSEFQTRPELLLHPQIPKPLHKLNLRSIVGKAEWDRIRNAAYAQHSDCCWACGSLRRQIGPTGKRATDLFAHEHFEFDYPKGEGRIVEVVALCIDCSNYIHIGQIKMLVQRGELPESELERISQHGGEVLKAAGLEKLPNSYFGPVASWSDWHILYQGQRYPTPYRDYNEWAREHGNPGMELTTSGWPMPSWIDAAIEAVKEDPSTRSRSLGEILAIKAKKAQEIIDQWNPETVPLMRYLRDAERATEGMEVSPYFIRDHALSEGLVKKVGGIYRK